MTDPESLPRGSVSHWLTELQAGDDAVAQQQLFERYFQRLVALARARLRDLPRRTEDEEDVAVDALNTFFEGMRQRRYPQLNDRTSLWPLLAKITACKAINQRERHLTQKRGAGKVRGDSLGRRHGDDSLHPRLVDFVGSEPTPEFALEMSEQCRILFDALPDEELQRIARLKLEGYANEEIAQTLNVVVRTVERKLQRIRVLWMDHS